MAMAMAFDFQRPSSAEHTRQILDEIAPAVRALVLTDARMPLMTPWLPWFKIDIPSIGNCFVIGEDHLAGLLNDEFALPETVLPSPATNPLFLIRLEGAPYQRLMLAAVDQSDLPVTAYSDRGSFLLSLRQAIDKLPTRPALSLIDFIVEPTMDFTSAQYHSLSGFAFLEQFPIQRLRAGPRVTGWGLLYHTFPPLTSVAARWGPDSALVSIGTHWYSAVSRECFGGGHVAQQG